MKMNQLLVMVALPLSLFCQLNAEEKDTPMTTEMKAASKALKELRKIKPGDWEAMAKTVRASHTALLKSMSETAALVKEMKDGPEKAIATADSRKLLGLCYAALCELEIAYLKKDAAAAAKAMEKIKEIKKEGHEKYSDD